MLGSCEHGKELVCSVKVREVSVFQDRLCSLEGGRGEKSITFNIAVNY
jgi:hypothetical protein